jgi:ABC-type glycerol-3-phosphate transport system substrate-binding protein
VTRRRAIAGGLAAAAGTVAGCGPFGRQGSGQPAARSPVAVEYLTSLNPRQRENHRTLLVDAFERAHPPVRLAISEWDRWPDKVVTLVASGTPPDATWFAYPEMYLGKLIQELTQLARRDRYNTRAFPKEPFEDYCTWRGRLVGLPNQSGGNWPVLPYNQDLLADR